jgi:hypothetical protein
MLHFISKGRIHRTDSGGLREIKCGAVEKYIANLEDIRKRQEWKNTGAGAQFRGAYQSYDSDANKNIRVRGVTPDDGGGFIYSAIFDGNVAIYNNVGSGPDGEGVVLRKNGIAILEMDRLRESDIIVAAGSEGGLDKHIAFIDMNKSECRFITEGDSVDSNPAFSRAEPDVIYYDSKGIATDAKTNISMFSHCVILRLDLSSGGIDEYVADKSYDYFKPRADASGNLYYIRRPYKEDQNRRMSASDVFLVPPKFLKAVFGWMDIFTRRYSGEALNTAGANPAKIKQLSEEELFIEGNLLNAEKNLLENKAAGEKYPGMAPKSWVLIRRDAQGAEHIVKKGVIDYCVYGDAVYYSNGSAIVRMNPASASEELVCAAELAQNLVWIDPAPANAV